MTFVLVTFALLVVTGVLMRSCVSRLAEATTLLNGLSAQDWVVTTVGLSAAASEVDEQISNSRAAWTK